MDELLLQVKDLTVSFPGRKKDDPRETAVNHLSFDIHRGEIVGVVGESGSGKSLSALSIMDLLPKDARIDGGEILFEGEDLLKMPPETRRKLKGFKMGMVFQEPMTSLNPVMKIEEQVGENLVLHTNCRPDEIHTRVVEALCSVGLEDAEVICRKYPHELSGGMRQRVMLALAAICSPDLIIADEPTTALDVVVQEQILNLLRKYNREKHVAILFISHDLNVIRRLCERTIVVYHGDIVEQGNTAEVMEHPQHEYTKTLVARIPERHEDGENTENVLSLEHLDVYYEMGGSFFRRKSRKHVIHDMSFNVHDGEILGIVGESGCGKSTLSKVILGLHRDYTGTVRMREGLRPQMVFQDPFGSLNPARKIGWIMEEPLKVRGIRDADERKRMVREMLEDCGLDPSFADRYPRELSGGQRQRISIGTALLMDTGFIIADEPVSALDVTVQSQIIKLIMDLHEKKHTTIMFISHDLDLVRRICRRVLVIYRGEIVEAGRSSEVYENPAHPYTKMLLAATRDDDRMRLTSSLMEKTQDADVKVPENFPGCPFILRCAKHREDCAHRKPDIVSLSSRHSARCTYAGGKKDGEDASL